MKYRQQKAKHMLLNHQNDDIEDIAPKFFNFFYISFSCAGPFFPFSWKFFVFMT